MRNLFLNGKKCWKKELENLKEENKKKKLVLSVTKAKWKG